MRKLVTGLVGILLLCLVAPSNLQAAGSGSPTKPGLSFGESSSFVGESSSFVGSNLISMEGMESDYEAWKRRRRRKKRTLAVGVVMGGPAGFGGRGIFRIKNFGVAADLTWGRVRTDAGPRVGAFTTKIDARFYRKGLLGKLLRVYAFGGATIQRGMWDETNTSSAVQIDAGVGGGIKLWSISINAEVGVLAPAVKPENYNPGFGVFGNVAVMLWLF